MTTLAGDAAFGAQGGCGCAHATDDTEDRAGAIGGVVYRGLVADRVADLERQMTVSTLRTVPGYRGWVLANVLSFLEGGYYGKDYVKDQSDVDRESHAQLRGAAFGLGTTGGTPGRAWRWYVPVAGSLSDADLAVGFGLLEKTFAVWGPDAKPRPSEDLEELVDAPDGWDDGEQVGTAGDAPPDAAEDLPADLVKKAQTWWTTAYGKDKVLNRVTIVDYEKVPSDAVRELTYDAWTNSDTKVYLAGTAHESQVLLETVLRHEAVHVRQFHDRGRPRTYEMSMTYEVEAYQEGIPRLEKRGKALEALARPTKAQDEELDAVNEQLGTIRAVVKILQEGLAQAQTFKVVAGRERFCRRLLIGRCLLPYHRALEDLYAPPKDQRNPAAVETVDETVDETEARGIPGGLEEDWSGEEGRAFDPLAELVVDELAGFPGDTERGDARETEGTDESEETDSAEFVGSEHKEIGDAGSGNELSSISYGSPPHPLTFGDVVSMAGDYFETYEQMRDLGRTADGRAELEWARWHCLELKGQRVPEPRVPDETKDLVVDRYYLLASRNVSHFSAGGKGWQTYTAWHGKAIADALEAGQTADQDLWRRALTKEAFGDHFLTDIFSAGHVRTPRREIRDWYERHQPGTSDAFVAYMAKYLFDRLDDRHQLPSLLWWLGWVTKSTMRDRIRELGGEAVNSFSLGDIVALALHNRDNKGLDVVSDVGPDGHPVAGGYAWRAVGDAHLAKIPYGPDTKAMATAAVIASLRDLERVRGVGVRLGSGSVSLAQKTEAVRTALGPQGFAARAFVPRESPVVGANPPYSRSDGRRAPLEWRWGQLGTEARAAVDDAVRVTIAGELLKLADKVKDPINAPLGIRVYGIRNAFRDFVRHLRTEGIVAIEKAVGRPAG